MMCQRIGWPPISTIGFGLTSVSSERRVPRPPARMTTFSSSPACGFITLPLWGRAGWGRRLARAEYPIFALSIPLSTPSPLAGEGRGGGFPPPRSPSPLAGEGRGGGSHSSTSRGGQSGGLLGRRRRRRGARRLCGARQRWRTLARFRDLERGLATRPLLGLASLLRRPPPPPPPRGGAFRIFTGPPPFGAPPSCFWTSPP